MATNLSYLLEVFNKVLRDLAYLAFETDLWKYKDLTYEEIRNYIQDSPITTTIEILSFLKYIADLVLNHPAVKRKIKEEIQLSETYNLPSRRIDYFNNVPPTLTKIKPPLVIKNPGNLNVRGFENEPMVKLNDRFMNDLTLAIARQYNLDLAKQRNDILWYEELIGKF